jgi:CRISPR-associated protein Csd1
MMFQALIDLYDRLDEKVPPFGFSAESIGFVITLDRAGNLVGQPEDLRTKINAQKYVYRLSFVPYTNQVNVRSGNAATTPNFMVDKADYIFGMSGNSKKDAYRHAFKRRVAEVCKKSDDEGVVAVKLFLETWNPTDSSGLEGWKEICGTHGKMVAFRLEGDADFIHERLAVKELWSAFIRNMKYKSGTCLVDGGKHKLQPQYAQFPFGTGASLVSFNKAAYESYGKSKGENAPISVEAEFKSSTALKYLLRSDVQRLRIGDATTLFWAEKESKVESFMGHVLNPSFETQQALIPVQKFLEAVRKGTLPNNIEKDRELKFYILGLSRNKARLALRFWYVCTVSELMRRLQDHFRCLDMERSEKDIPFPGIWHLLKETARETKDISPVLGGAIVRAILTGTNYPQNLYQGVLGRIRVDHRVGYLRASILKAVLQRNHNKEVSMTLDMERREVAYLLGRLFAVLERAQLDALGKVNTTIKDRFFSSASATPASVFPRLIRLSQHHIEKSEYGHISDQRISAILEHVREFPIHLNLQDQGLFAIAYYHQKNAIEREIKENAAKKKSAKIEGDENE